jgi:hypothetical protein
MAAKTTYIATAPDGSVHTRTTARTYEYAVMIYSVDYGATEPTWGPIGFCGRYDLAAKLAKQWAGKSPTIVPATKKEK